MPEVLDRGTGAHLVGDSDTRVPEASYGQEGWLPLPELEEGRLYIEDGPTGWSAYWPELLAFIHPDLATTDSSLNGVDVVWMPLGRDRVQIRVELKSTPSHSLTDVVEGLREALGLPVAQVAAMCGIKRRQFYNLLDGKAASASRERWIRVLGDSIAGISRAAGGDEGRIRAAILGPMSDGMSVFEAATDQDYNALKQAANEVSQLLQTGQVSGRLPKPVLRSPQPGSATRTSEFLADYRDDGEDER